MKAFTGAERITFDANILVYSLDSMAGKKHSRSVEIIKLARISDCVLTLQSLSEFFYVVTRKGKLATKTALDHIKDWQAIFPTVTAKPITLHHAVATLERYQLAFWDAMLLATAKEANVSVLVSEDFQHSQVVEGVKIFNPFQEEK